MIGRCTPVAKVLSLGQSSAAEGDLIEVDGADFLPSTEARCRFVFPGTEEYQGENVHIYHVRAAFFDESKVMCQ
eukprot:1054174-Prorocentrum_minimum.AAC.1